MQMYQTTISGVVDTFPALQPYSIIFFTAIIMSIVPILFVTSKKDLKSKKVKVCLAITKIRVGNIV
jgi:hypothetical protein